MKGLRLTRIVKKKKENSNQKIFLQSIKHKKFETNTNFHVKIRNTEKV